MEDICIHKLLAYTLFLLLLQILFVFRHMFGTDSVKRAATNLRKMVEACDLIDVHVNNTVKCESRILFLVCIHASYMYMLLKYYYAS